MRHDEVLLTDDRLWTCLTCLQCSQVCPAAVAYSDLTLGLRTEARRLGAAAVCTHGEAIHAWMRLMMRPKLKQDRLGWLTRGEKEEEKETGEQKSKGAGEQKSSAAEKKNTHHTSHITHHATRNTQHELRLSDNSDTLYFVGCAPYYGALFKPLGVDGNRIAQSTVRVLNTLGIEPQVLADERCCGHDLLWEGDVAGFRTLAELNAKIIRQTGVKRIVTSCPECARALKVDYPNHGINLDVVVMHLAEMLANSEWQITPQASTITYHDPCRLGRHLGVYDAPRQVIERLGLDLVEMPRHGPNALCCGTNGWTHCGIANKAIQVDRLREAKTTGADLLVTACIKCQIHLKCAMQDQLLGDEIAIEIKDLAALVAETLN
jgi:Fe-S oxidoreductase